MTLRLSDVLGTGETLTLRLDGGSVRTLSRGSTLDFEERRLSDGVHTYSAQVTDRSGNVVPVDLNGSLPGLDYTFQVV
ncbi:MAG TPA: hypothetical protein VEA81_06665 [Burkholderiaceae bacterium]|nr:hypothetical protein [Burkholderiaceae bacterium]